MSYIAWSLLAATFFALSIVFNKFVSKHKIENRNTLMFYFMSASFLLAFVLFPFTSKVLPSKEVFFNIFITTSTFLVGYYLFFVGISKTEASVIAPLFQLQAALVAILAYFFLGETFPLNNYLWIGMIIIGVILVSADEKINIKNFFGAGIISILTMQILHAVSNLFVGFSLQNLSFIDILFWEYTFIGFFIVPFYLLTKPKINYPTKSVLHFGIATYLSSVGALFLFKAFEENLTISSTISLMSSPLVFLITIFASKFKPELLEHHPAKVYAIRALGVVAILISAIELSLS